MDEEAIISGLEEIARVEAALKRRLRENGTASEAGEGHPVSDRVEYRPHADAPGRGPILLSQGRYGKEQGPYWYFRYHEGGKQKKPYLGKAGGPEGELARKRA